MVLPVGSTGIRKRVGDFTREDTFAFGAHLRAKGHQLLDEAEKWTAAAEQMEEGETLEQALPRITTPPTKLVVAARAPTLTTEVE